MKPFTRKRDEQERKMHAVSRRRDGAVRNDV